VTVGTHQIRELDLLFVPVSLGEVGLPRRFFLPLLEGGVLASLF